MSNERKTDKLQGGKHSISRQFIISILTIVSILVAIVIFMINLLLTQTFNRESYMEIVNRTAYMEQVIELFVTGTYDLSYESEPSGEGGAKIKRKYIQNLIERFSDYDNGNYSFIMDGEGIVLAHPNPEYIDELIYYENQPKTSVESDGYEAIAQRVKAGESGIEIVEGESGMFYVSYTPIQLPGDFEPWFVVTMQNRSQAMSVVNDLTINIVIIALVFALSAVMIILMLIGRITSPIAQMSEIAVKFSIGDFSNRVEYESENEIGFLAKVFNQMADDIIKHMDTLTQATREKERVESEIRIATKIQKDMLPDVSGRFSGDLSIDIEAFVKPALEMGGDFYDAFYLDEKKQKLCIAIGDVSGKGVPAAMFMAITKSLIQDYILNGESPSDALKRANNHLCKDNPESMFVTAFLAVIDLVIGNGVYAQAGHNPVAYCGDNEEFVFMENEPTMPLGFFPNQIYPSYELKFTYGNRYFLYTDGVTEALDITDSEWGEEAFLDTLNKHKNSPCHNLIDAVRIGIAEHAKGAKQSDDITMLTVASLRTEENRIAGDN